MDGANNIIHTVVSTVCHTDSNADKAIEKGVGGVGGVEESATVKALVAKGEEIRTLKTNKVGRVVGG